MLYQHNLMEPQEEQSFHRQLRKLARHALSNLKIPDHVLIQKEDCISEAVLAGLKAAQTFDIAIAAKFSTHALPRMRFAIIDYMRSVDPLPRAWRKAVAELTAGKQDDMEEATVKEAHRLMYARNPFSLQDKPDSQQAFYRKTGRTWEEILEDVSKRRNGSVRRDEWIKLIRRIDDERIRIVLIEYHLQERKLEEIAEVFGLTCARISQLKKRGETMLKRLLKDEITM